MAHITIPEQTLSKSYTVGTTATDTFAITWKFFTEADIEVYDNGTLLSSSDYTVTGTPDSSGVGFNGGNVVLNTAVTNTTIVLNNNSPIERTTDFPDVGPFNIKELNSELDQFVILFQQLSQSQDRNIQIAPGDTLDGQLPSIGTPLYFLRINSAGTGLEWAAGIASTPDASGVSFDDSTTSLGASDVQGAIEALDALTDGIPYASTDLSDTSALTYNADTDVSGNGWVDTDVSNNSSTKVPVESAVKAYVDGVNSLTTNGYQQLSNGLIIQWGYEADPGSSTATAVTFPIAFPTACLNVTATRGPGGTGNGAPYIQTKSTTGAQIDSSHGDTDKAAIYWMAIGY